MISIACIKGNEYNFKGNNSETDIFTSFFFFLKATLKGKNWLLEGTNFLFYGKPSFLKGFEY